MSCAEGACLTTAGQDGLGEESADAGASGLGLHDGCRSCCGTVQVQAPAQQDGVIWHCRSCLQTLAVSRGHRNACNQWHSASTHGCSQKHVQSIGRVRATLSPRRRRMAHWALRSTISTSDSLIRLEAARARLLEAHGRCASRCQPST